MLLLITDNAINMRLLDTLVQKLKNFNGIVRLKKKTKSKSVTNIWEYRIDRKYGWLEEVILLEKMYF